jgi:hypothetical protein
MGSFLPILVLAVAANGLLVMRLHGLNQGQPLPAHPADGALAD